MKKQSRTTARRKSQKRTPLNDLSPRAKKAAGVKAGAVDMFRTGSLEPVQGTHEKWIEISSVSLPVLR